MVTRDVFQVLKLHSPAARAILRTFKTSLVPIYHVMHSRSYDFLYIFYTDILNFMINSSSDKKIANELIMSVQSLNILRLNLLK